MPMPEAPKKTERSHEENQERAYIAASRRTDRSLEARVQSARMASDIHKRRTGKSFRITEDIVMKEEMYEEEDDDLPRSYRVLGPNMQTSSPELNYRVGAYFNNRLAMSKMVARTDDDWRNNEVNTKFAQLFPQHARQNSDTSPVSPPQPPQQLPQQHQQLPQQHQQLPQQHQHQHQQQSPFPQRPQPVTQQFHSMPSHSDPFPSTQQFYAQPHQTAQQARTFSTSGVSQCSPQHPELLRQDSGVALPGSPSTFNHSPHPNSPMDLGSSRSAFTAELPSEARMLMMSGVDMSAGYDSASHTWPTIDSSFDMTGVPRGSRSEEEQVISPTSDTFDMSNLKWDPMMAPMDDSTWNTFINDNAWTDGQ
ncbi:hypothetical protein BBO_07727 [Beauveria brongniartii RCEF 3172]|uniref:Uncharacterized protein n=1 Tax=Beauveria brongniartii RCEF 3172 TaxID=1081107 RepID=A0A166YXM3_9HYPO|nr:hypothetical protein BBO_07727 [Beauveria brongniartii RCEF 3172]